MVPSVAPSTHNAHVRHKALMRRKCKHAGSRQSMSQHWSYCSWGASSGRPKRLWALPSEHGSCAAPSFWRASQKKMRATGQAARASTVSQPLLGTIPALLRSPGESPCTPCELHRACDAVSTLLSGTGDATPGGFLSQMASRRGRQSECTDWCRRPAVRK